MGQEMEQMHQMLMNVQQSMEARDLEIKEQANFIKAFDAETKRLTALQAGLTPEQVQELVMNTLSAALDTGDVIAQMSAEESRGEQNEML